MIDFDGFNKDIPEVKEFLEGGKLYTSSKEILEVVSKHGETVFTGDELELWKALMVLAIRRQDRLANRMGKQEVVVIRDTLDRKDVLEAEVERYKELGYIVSKPEDGDYYIAVTPDMQSWFDADAFESTDEDNIAIANGGAISELEETIQEFASVLVGCDWMGVPTGDVNVQFRVENLSK